MVHRCYNDNTANDGNDDDDDNINNSLTLMPTTKTAATSTDNHNYDILSSIRLELSNLPDNDFGYEM